MKDLTREDRFSAGPPLYQRYGPEEDRQRTNLHYDRPAEFFCTITGGEWNTYSANLWETARNETESQEDKLDLMARLVGLRPGQRLLDVGCGWAGPLVYLSRAYGIQGVGLTLSSTQKCYADERIARYGADVRVVESHWRGYEDRHQFDVVLADESSVHMSDLVGFFSKAHALLREGGRMVNKDLHFTHPAYSTLMGRAAALVNGIYGATGNWRTLAEELVAFNQAGFNVQKICQMPTAHYQITLDHWLSNMHRNKTRLLELVGPEYYRQFRAYMKIVRQHVLAGDRTTMDIVVADKMPPLDRRRPGHPGPSAHATAGVA